MGENSRLIPSLRVRYIGLRQDRFSETGGSMALTGEELDLDSLKSGLGARIVRDSESDVGSKRFVTELKARWDHEFMDDMAELDASLLGLDPMLIEGVELAADTAVVGGSLSIIEGSNWVASLAYDASLNSELTQHAIGLTIGKHW